MYKYTDKYRKSVTRFMIYAYTLMNYNSLKKTEFENERERWMTSKKVFLLVSGKTRTL